MTSFGSAKGGSHPDQTNTTRRMKINYSHTLGGIDKDLTRAGMDGELPRVKERGCLLAAAPVLRCATLLVSCKYPEPERRATTVLLQRTLEY